MNTPIKLSGLTGVIALLLGCVPPQYAAYVSVFILACACVTAMFPPPHAGSRWVVAYLIISKIGLNIGWAENHFKPGVSGVRVPLLNKPAAKQAVIAAGIPVLSKKGAPEPTTAAMSTTPKEGS